MAMFPIFILGLLVGVGLGVTLTNMYIYNKVTAPSETKFRLKEAELIKYKSDIELLKETNEMLCEEIKKLKTKNKK